MNKKSFQQHQNETPVATVGSNWGLYAPTRPCISPRQRDAAQRRVTVRCQNPLKSMGDIMTNRSFWSDIAHVESGWICQDVTGCVATRKLNRAVSFETLLSDITEWSRTRAFQNRLIILIAKHETTDIETTRRLREINNVLKSQFGAMIRLCLVTASDLVYLRHHAV